jgi:hypothetical protein
MGASVGDLDKLDFLARWGKIYTISEKQRLFGISQLPW